MLLGIDPGITGSICFFDDSGVKVIDFPVITKKAGKTKAGNTAYRRSYDIPKLREILREHTQPGDSVVIEAQAARSHDGTIQAFSIGRSFGTLEGLCVGLDLEVKTVKPSVWKRKMGIERGAEKDISRELALEIFPELREQLKLKKDHNRAEAVLIMEYARRFMRQS